MNHKNPFILEAFPYVTMIEIRFTSALTLGLLVIVALGCHNFGGNYLPYLATAQLLTEPPEGPHISGNQMMSSNVTSNLIPYDNPNLGFSLGYPPDWQKEETLTFISPQGGVNNRAPEAISVTTELLPTSNFSLDRYNEAALGQIESFQDFKLLNSSSTVLAGLPAHMIVYSFTNEQSQTPVKNLQAWTIKDGIAYVITYSGTPEEFDSSLPALQSVMDSFRLE